MLKIGLVFRKSEPLVPNARRWLNKRLGGIFFEKWMVSIIEGSLSNPYLKISVKSCYLCPHLSKLIHFLQ